MDFQSDDYNKLQKIGIKHFLELCLCVPKNYTDTTIIKELKNDSIGVFEVEILEHSFGRNMLKIGAFLPLFHKPIALIFFHPKPFHKKIFSISSKLFIYGKLQIQFSQLSILQPKVVQQINTISLHFKKPSIKDITLQNLCLKYITMENLQTLPIPKKYFPHIYNIFHPSKDFLHFFFQNKTFPKDSLQALKFIEIFHHISSLSKKRRYFPAKFLCNGEYKDFITSLPFTLTPSQSQAIKDISKDLKNKNAARRIIMGDVGCGKTIVILASVFMTYPYTTILMVPTTILAMQIYEEAKKFLPQYIQIECITSATKSSENTLLENQAHFIIGTQALLYQKIQSKDLALVITDEQHRFGTNQRHQLEKIAQGSLESKPHFLQFSATPIPRTLSMINSNLIDYSFIKDLPFKKDITTKIIHKKDFNSLLTHIQNEIKANHQCVIVYPLVEESEHIDYLSLEQGAPFWQKHFENVFVTFGGDKNKEEILENFRDHGDILLATTLIEVGISLPRLSTIVIIAPERMGLATLHQLRGRVSRNGLKGYCFLYTNNPKSPRLIEFSKHLSGFDIAELDLKYRNGGDLLQGDRQSGESFKFFNMQEDYFLLQEAQALIQKL
ncbi:ATP-dependent DNA helicase RecG [Helicobacter anseris]|uniref:ATP-dependent DNA helicase RecG n=2 Tax=Helicobacter anseris TaxID=375926 RepID=A0A3D8J2Z9_9HELI|nr:ATP-dependent DNA helicase RecG [Helicobacter anseris]